MNDAQKLAEAKLKDPGIDYARIDAALLTKLQLELASSFSPGPPGDTAPAPSAFEYLALGAPASFDAAPDKKRPLLAATRQSDMRAWEVDFRGNFHLVCMDLHTGKLTLGLRPFQWAMSAETATPSRNGPAPDATQLFVSDMVRAIDLKEDMPEALAEGHYAVTALVYDRHSNTVDFVVAGAGKPAAPLAKAAPSAFAKDEPAPPEAPGEPGAIVLAIPAAGSAEPVPVTGGFCLAAAGAPVAPGSSDKAPHVMRATLLLVELDAPFPRVVEVMTPVQVTEEAVRGSFAFDLHDAAPGLAAGSYQAYLFAGSLVAGPMPFVLSRP